MNKENNEVYIVMTSDEDQPAIETITASMKEDMSLVVDYYHTDYDYKSYSCSVHIVVDSNEARRLARRLNIEPVDLPIAICRWTERESQIVNPSFSDVQACFKKITRRLINNGCHYRIVRKYDKYGVTLC